MGKHTDQLTAFIDAYERATNSHDTAQLAPLIAFEAVYWFTDGSHRGREAILGAIADTFRTISDETYRIYDLEWVVADDRQAVCRYRFSWRGFINGHPRSGGGRGTNVLVRSGESWQVLHEHLSA